MRKGSINLLFVEDQKSVRDGIAAGVHFKDCGISECRMASSGEEALKIMAQMPMDILFMDIEMPGMNGLELNRIIQNKYPDTVRVMLTSHASFDYAQESLKHGCFDYLLQPAEPEMIEDCLKRAVQFIVKRDRGKELMQYASLVRQNAYEIMNHTVLNLFSLRDEDRDSSLELLQQFAIPLNLSSECQLLYVVSDDFKKAEDIFFTEKEIWEMIEKSLEKARIGFPFEILHTVNSYHEFILLFFTAENKKTHLKSEQIREFYENIRQKAEHMDISVYAGESCDLQNIMGQVHEVVNAINENIAHKPGCYILGEEVSTQGTKIFDLSECVKRWEKLISSDQKKILENEIESYIARIVNESASKFKDLCELHQQLTHIFFLYFYQNDIDTTDLFTQEYTYQEYMDSFKDVESLRKGVRFMLEAVERVEKKNTVLGDVERAKKFIVDNLSTPITVKDVADHVHLSSEYFTKIFKLETGQNIKEYIILSKLEAAKEMLSHTNISVSLISIELGYTNFSHFSQIFKKYENVSPSEYRAKSRENK